MGFGMTKFLAVLLLSLCLAVEPAALALAATFYLDNSAAGASDGNAGTVSSSPWKTLLKASAAMAAGEVLNVGSSHSSTFTMETATLTGTVGTSGSAVGVTVSGCGASCPHNVTYTELTDGSDGTTTAVATHFTAQFVADSTILTIGCYATSSSNVVSFQCPSGTTFATTGTVNTTNTLASAAITFTFAGTPANPNYIFDLDSATFTTLVKATAATHATFATAVGNPKIAGSFYEYGLEFTNTGNIPGWVLANSGGGTVQIHDNCKIAVTGTTGSITIGTGQAPSKTYLKDCVIKTANAASQINLFADMEIMGAGQGSFLQSGGVASTSLFTFGSSSIGTLTIDGVDLSAETGNLVAPVTGTKWSIIAKNSKTGTTNYLSATPTQAGETDFYGENIDSSGTWYKQVWRRFTGSIDTDTTNFLNGGTTYDGTHGISFKMTGTGNASLALPARSPILLKRSLTSGSPVTITAQGVFDATAFGASVITNKQAWLKCGYQGVATSPLMTFTDDRVANLLSGTASSNQASSVSTWTAPGLTTPTAVQFALTFTPLLSGYYECWMEHALASNKVLWIDPTLH